MLVIGLLPTLDVASLCLSNLAEADFVAENISVITRDSADAARIATAGGPLTGLAATSLATALVGRKLPPATASHYQMGVASGKVFIAIAAGDAADAAAEMLHDCQADAVRLIDEG